MTTALVGKHGKQATKARVALVSRRGGGSLASTLARMGHDLVEFGDWDAFAAAGPGMACDLVLCDEDSAAASPSDCAAPVLLLSDRSAGPTPSAGVIAPAALATALEPLLAMAVELGMARAACREQARMTDGIRSGEALRGCSPVMRRLQGALRRAADCDATVLIEGPPGAGKSLAARVVHCKSRRAARPLLAIECGATSVEELGRAIETARDTTLLLEAIERLSAAAQSLLVRHLKERGTGAVPRLIVTTSAHLPELVARGAFREDLYYRLHAFPIVVPALRERLSDIPLLAQAIVELSAPAGVPTPLLTPAATATLESMPWSGNVTQLETVVRRAQLLAGGGPIDREHLLAVPVGSRAADVAPSHPTGGNAEEAPEVGEDSILPFEQEEQRMLTRALRATKGNVRKAAQLLGIGRATLYRKIQQYRLRLQ